MSNPLLLVNPADHILRVDGGITILDTLSVLQDLDNSTTAEPFTMKYNAQFKDWCEHYGVYYYGAPAEDFKAEVGIDEADTLGAEYVMMENLS